MNTVLNINLEIKLEKYSLNPLLPTNAVRKQKKKYLRRFFQFNTITILKYHASENLKFNNLHIFQSLKLRILMEKILSISLNLNFTSDTLGGYGLNL